MVRIGKRALEKERLVRSRRKLVETRDRAFRHVARRIELFRHARAPGLREIGALVAERIVRSAQRVRIGMPLAQPAGVVAFDLVAVLDGEIDRLEAVVGIVEVVPGIVPPLARDLLVVAAARAPAEGLAGRRPGERRAAGHVLQMQLADRGGAIAGGAQQIDEGHGVERQRNAVVAHAVERRRPARHQGRAVRHADRRVHVEAVEAHALGRDRSRSPASSGSDCRSSRDDPPGADR